MLQNKYQLIFFLFMLIEHILLMHIPYKSKCHISDYRFFFLMLHQMGNGVRSRFYLK
jgi:hypothetical protein